MKNVWLLVSTLLLLGPWSIAGSVLAQPFDPGTTYPNLDPIGGARGACTTVEPNALTSTVCERDYNATSRRMTVHVYASDKGATQSETAIALLKDFTIAAAASGQETELNGSLISMDIGWHGLLIGVGPQAKATFQVEVVVTDRTTNTRVGYELVENKELTGAFKFFTVAGFSFPVPAPDFTVERTDLRHAVLPVTLKRGHTYRVALRVVARASGAVSSAGEVKFNPSPGGPFGHLAADRFVNWEGLAVTVGEDRFEGLEQRVDALETTVAAHDEAIEQNAEVLAQHAEALAAIGAELDALKASIQALRDDLNAHTHPYLTGRGNGHNNTEAATAAPTFPGGEPTARQNAVSMGPIGGMIAQADYREAATATAQTLENVGTAIPTDYALQPNYPNPFNPTTTIPFDVPETARVTLKIYDLAGREVDTLVADQLVAGTHRARWNAGHLASGTYFYRLEAGSFVATRRMALVK